jgi:hypothetical protein
MILTVLKLLVVLAFLIRFIRRPSVVWGIGLLTVTTAVLLDTLLGAFNRDQLLADLGFFFYVIAGLLLAGSATWFWGVARQWLPGQPAPVAAVDAPVAAPSPDASTNAAPAVLTPASPVPPGALIVPQTNVKVETTPSPTLPPPHTDGFAEAGFDRQMLHDQVRRRFGPDDLRDLMFDLDVNELDVIAPGQTTDELIVRVLDAADRNGQAPAVALAVERILTPPPPEHMPRLEKLSDLTPRTVMRHFVLAHYSIEELQELAAATSVDWEQLEGGNKKEKVRSLLLYLYRRNRIDDLLQAMRAAEA